MGFVVYLLHFQYQSNLDYKDVQKKKLTIVANLSKDDTYKEINFIEGFYDCLHAYSIQQYFDIDIKDNLVTDHSANQIISFPLQNFTHQDIIELKKMKKETFSRNVKLHEKIASIDEKNFKKTLLTSNELDDLRIILGENNPLNIKIVDNTKEVSLIGLTSDQYDDFIKFYQNTQSVLLMASPSPFIKEQSHKFIFNLLKSEEEQGEQLFILLAKNKSLATNTVFLISHESNQDHGFLKGFEGAISSVDNKIKNDHVKIKDDITDLELETIIKSKLNHDMIAFDLNEELSVKLIKIARDYEFKGRLVGFHCINKKDFYKNFSEFTNEILQPGFYTENLMGITPFMAQLIHMNQATVVNDYIQHYKTLPSSEYAYGFDTGLLYVNFIQKLKKDNIDVEDIDSVKFIHLFKKYLNNLIKIPVAHEGFTSKIIFDDHNQRMMKSSVFVYRNNKQVPFYKQFHQDYSNAAEIINYKKSRDQKTKDIFFTTIGFNKLNKIDLAQQTFSADFYLTFRSSLPIQPNDLVFSNNVKNNLSMNVIKSIHIDNQYYSVIQGSGDFLFSPTPQELLLGQFHLPIVLHHKNLDAEKMIFIVDDSEAHHVEINPAVNLTLINHDTQLSDNLFVSSANDADPKMMRNFSVVTHAIKLESHNLLRTLMSFKYALPFVMLFIFNIFYLIQKNINNDLKNLLLFIASRIMLAATLFVIEIVLFSSQFINEYSIRFLLNLQKGFMAAYFILITMMLDALVFYCLKTPSTKSLELVLKCTIRSINYFIMLSFYVAFVLKQDVLPLFATSSVFLTILGLGIREIILDILGGITIAIEKSIQIKDWVRIKYKEQEILGEVKELGWRNVVVHSRDHQVHFIPNSICIQNVLSNTSLYQGYYGVDIPFQISTEANIDKIVALILEELQTLLAHNQNVDHLTNSRVHCTEIDSRGTKLFARVFYRSEKSRDEIKTEALGIINKILIREKAYPNVALDLQR